MFITKSKNIIFIILSFLLLSCGIYRHKSSLEFGNSYARESLWEDTLFWWEDYWKDKKKNHIYYNNMAIYYENSGDLSKAEIMYKKALKLFPLNPIVLDNYKKFLNRLENKNE